MALLLFPGSRRRHSHNGRLIDELASRLEGRCRIDVLRPAEVDLPLFDQDLEADPAVASSVAAIHARFAAADGFIVASPEYNGQLTSYLKNTVDWVSRLPHIDQSYRNPFRGRPLLLCCATTGWSGGILGLQHARALFSYLGCLVMPEQICVPHAEQALAELDPFFAEHIGQTLRRLEELTTREQEHAGRG